MLNVMQELNTFTGWLLIASLKSLPLIVIIMLTQHGLRKYLSANTRHSLWLSLLICLSIPTGWHVPFDSRSVELFFITPANNPAITAAAQKVDRPAATAAHISSHNDTDQTASIHPTTDTTASTIDYHSILSLFWATIFCGLIGMTWLQLVRFRRLQQQATHASTQQYALLDKYKSHLGVTQTIPLLYSPRITSPLTLGLIKPTIILPIGIEQQVTEKQLGLVLLHELTHIQRRDIWWNWLVYGITLLHWFNPLLWFASKRIKADMEIACDAQVLAHLSPQDRNDYGLALISLSQHASKPRSIAHGLGILENHHELKNRLTMMKEFTTMTLKKSIVFGLVFTTFAFVALAQTNNQPDKANNISPSTTNSRMTLAEFAKKAGTDLKTPILVGNVLSDTSIPVSITEKPLDYGQFLSQLKINELTAYKSSGYIQIVAAGDARWLAIPTVEKGKKYFDDEYVTDSIKLEKTCAGNILISLRPLVPQYGHLTTMESANTLIISDFYSNIVRIKALVKTLEDNTPEKVDCSPRNTETQRAPKPEKNNP